MSNTKITDLISGNEVVATPEEVEAVQPFLKVLLEDYKYPKSHIQTRPQHRVKSRPSDTIKTYPVDIAIFSNAHKQDDQLSIIVECKKKNRKDGIEQLEDYLRFSKAKLGVWFNGQERVFLLKVEHQGTVSFETIPNIPKYGERIEDIGKFKRKDLIKPSDLKQSFEVIRNYLAGNASGTTRDEELAKQLINVIFCKIYDEKFTDLEDAVSFRYGVKEDKKTVSTRIRGIFENVKQKYNQVIGTEEVIDLDDRSICYIVGELQNFCIIDSERDAIAEAFETFIGHALKGAQGQFFTPRNVARLMTLVGNPNEETYIIDPACGSGGFLIESLRYVWDRLDEKGWSKSAIEEEKRAVAIKNINGIEKDTFLSRVAKSYMAILGDGKGGIVCEDALDNPKDWKPHTTQIVALSKYDVVLTNPPFGKDIKVTGESKLKQYKLASGKKEVSPDILFIERSLQLLKDGGTLGIILPETFFHAPKQSRIREYFKEHNIKALIDLPHNTFRPHNNAKCIAVFIQKNTIQQKDILMIVAEEIGHDHQGKPLYRWDKNTHRSNKEELWDDIPLIEAELKNNDFKKYVFTVPSQTCKETDIYVPRFYWNAREKEIYQIAKEQGFQLISMKTLVNENIVLPFDGHGSPPAENKGNGEIPYIRVKDIVNWDVYKDPTAKIPVHVYESLNRPDKALNENDILYVRRGSFRIGSVALVTKYDTEVLLTREIKVFRVNTNKRNITPYYLLFALSHPLVKLQTKNKIFIETTLPNIGERWQDLLLPIPLEKDKLIEISENVRSIFELKGLALEKLNSLHEFYGSLTT
jgi:type I restriction enzyme M protein